MYSPCTVIPFNCEMIGGITFNATPSSRRRLSLELRLTGGVQYTTLRVMDDYFLHSYSCSRRLQDVAGTDYDSQALKPSIPACTCRLCTDIPQLNRLQENLAA